jgi:hypothetical protein
VMAALRQRHGTLAAVKGHELRQALVTQMTKVRLAGVARLFARVAEIALGDNPKRADGSQRSAVIAVQFVPMITVDDELAFESARQVETLEEDIAGIMATLPRIAVALTGIVIALARVVIRRMFGRVAPELDPVHLDLAGILVAMPRIIPSRIVAAGHRVPPFRELVKATDAVGYSGGMRGRDSSRRNAG